LRSRHASKALRNLIQQNKNSDQTSSIAVLSPDAISLDSTTKMLGTGLARDIKALFRTTPMEDRRMLSFENFRRLIEAPGFINNK